MPIGPDRMKCGHMRGPASDPSTWLGRSGLTRRESPVFRLLTATPNFLQTSSALQKQQQCPDGGNVPCTVPDGSGVNIPLARKVSLSLASPLPGIWKGTDAPHVAHSSTHLGPPPTHHNGFF